MKFVKLIYLIFISLVFSSCEKLELGTEVKKDASRNLSSGLHTAEPVLKTNSNKEDGEFSAINVSMFSKSLTSKKAFSIKSVSNTQPVLSHNYERYTVNIYCDGFFDSFTFTPDSEAKILVKSDRKNCFLILSSIDFGQLDFYLGKKQVIRDNFLAGKTYDMQERLVSNSLKVRTKILIQSQLPSDLLGKENIYVNFYYWQESEQGSTVVTLPTSKLGTSTLLYGENAPMFMLDEVAVIEENDQNILKLNFKCAIDMVEGKCNGISNNELEIKVNNTIYQYVDLGNILSIKILNPLPGNYEYQIYKKVLGTNSAKAIGNIEVQGNQKEEQSIPDLKFYAFEQISTNGKSACGIVSGKIYCWGESKENSNVEGVILGSMLGRENSGSKEVSAKLINMPDKTSFIKVSLGPITACALTSEGKLYQWGTIYKNNNLLKSSNPVEVNFEGSITPVDYQCGGYGTSCVLHSNGKITCKNKNGIEKLHEAPEGEIYTSLKVDELKACALSKNNNSETSVYCWKNSDMDPTAKKINITHEDNPHIEWIELGHTLLCYQTSKKKHYCFGNNIYGEASRENKNPAILDALPIELNGDQDIVEYSAGTFGSCALTSRKELMCSGNIKVNMESSYNSYDLNDTHLNSSLTLRYVTSEIANHYHAKSLSFKGNSGCVLTSAHDVYCFGSSFSDDQYPKLIKVEDLK